MGAYLFFPGFGLSLFLFFVLLAVSDMDTTWTLNFGKSRQIVRPFLNSEILVSSGSPEVFRYTKHLEMHVLH